MHYAIRSARRLGGEACGGHEGSAEKLAVSRRVSIARAEAHVQSQTASIVATFEDRSREIG